MIILFYIASAVSFREGLKQMNLVFDSNSKNASISVYKILTDLSALCGDSAKNIFLQRQ